MITKLDVAKVTDGAKNAYYEVFVLVRAAGGDTSELPVIGEDCSLNRAAGALDDAAFGLACDMRVHAAVRALVLASGLVRRHEENPIADYLDGLVYQAREAIAIARG